MSRTAAPSACAATARNPFTHGALCPKVNRYLDALHGPDRVVHPLRRVGAKGEGRFERIGWDEAIEATAAGLRSAIERHGPESVLPYYFAGTEGMVQGWIMGPRLFAAMGASRLRTTICTAAAGAALKATYGGSVGMDPEDFEHANLVILWGANLLSTNLHQWRFVLAAQKRGAHVVAIDPLRTDTAARCDEHLAPAPGHRRGARARADAHRARRGRRGSRLARAPHGGLARARGPAGRVAGRARRRGLRPARRRACARSGAGSRTRARPRSASASACSGTAAPARPCARCSRCPR